MFVSDLAAGMTVDFTDKTTLILSFLLHANSIYGRSIFCLLYAEIFEFQNANAVSDVSFSFSIESVL